MKISLRVLIITLAILLLSSSVSIFLPHQAVATDTIFGNATILSSAGSDLPQLTTIKTTNNVYEVWTKTGDIFFKKSADSGTTFGSAINLSNSVGTSTDPQINAFGNNVYAVWRDNTRSVLNYDVFVAVSHDKGTTFANPVKVSNIDSSNDTSSNTFIPQITSSGNNVYVVWLNRDHLQQIFCVRSTDNGTTFSSPINLNPDRNASFAPRIAANGTNLYVVFHINTNDGGTGILFRESTDSGATFGPVVRVDNSLTDSFTPQLSVSGKNVYIVWRDNISGTFDTLLAASTDNGNTFGTPINLSNNIPSVSAINQQVTSSGKNAYVVWEADGIGSADILFTRSVNNGSSFGTVSNLSNNTGNSFVPQVATLGASVFVTWADSTPGSSLIFFSTSSDSGQTFGAPTHENNFPDSGNIPEIGISNTNVYLTWAQQGDILFKTALIPNSPPSINITSTSNSSPRWGVDPVSVSGSVAGSVAGDTVTISWGDGTTSTANAITGTSWGPVIHSYASSAIGTNPNSIVATLVSSGNTVKATSTASIINVQPHATSLTLAAINNAPWSRPTSFTATLKDTDAGSVAISSRTISFNGTGVISAPNASTNATGIAIGHGTAPSSIATGWRVETQFAGDSSYKSSHSIVRTYSTLRHNTSLALAPPVNVPWSGQTTLTAILSDSSAGNVRVSAGTISFNGTGVISVANVSTNATGVAVGHGTAPTTVATGWREEARFAGNALYNSANSAIRTYNTLVHNTSLTLTLTPTSLVHGAKYNATGTLRDTTTSVNLGSGTITFTATIPITIPSTTTSGTGAYSTINQISPSTAGSYSITSHFAATSLYGASNSPSRTLSVS